MSITYSSLFTARLCCSEELCMRSRMHGHCWPRLHHGRVLPAPRAAGAQRLPAFVLPASPPLSRSDHPGFDTAGLHPLPSTFGPPTRNCKITVRSSEPWLETQKEPPQRYFGRWSNFFSVTAASFIILRAVCMSRGRPNDDLPRCELGPRKKVEATLDPQQ